MGLWAGLSIGMIAQPLSSAHAAYLPVQGGTGTATIPAAGQTLIGNSSGTYTPAYILCAGTCSVATSSGGITITGTGVATNTGNWAGTWQLYNPSDFLASSTTKVISVNGLSGVVTITSSTLGVVWPTVNGTQASAYQIVPGTGLSSNVSGATTTLSVNLNSGSAVTCSANQFLNTLSATGTAACGTITFPTPMAYTFSAGTGISISQATSSSNTTTTVTLNINNGSVQNCAAGTYANQLSATAIISCGIAVNTIAGVNTSTISFIAAGGTKITTSTNSITFTTVSTSTANSWTALQTYTQGITVNGPVQLASTTNALLVTDGSGNVTGYAGSTCSAGNAPRGVSATGTVQNCTAYLTGNQSVTLTISGDATGTASGATSIADSIQVTGLLGKALPSLATGTLYYSNGAWSINNSFLTSAITSVNGNTSAAQTFTGGTGISVASAGGNTTTTNTGVTSVSAGTGISVSSATGTPSITNTGVTTFTGSGCVTAANSTGTVALTVTCISGNQNITFTIAGDATGTASGATAITDSITVTGLNGKALPANTTGTLQYSAGAWSINLATSSLGLYSAGGVLSSYTGSSCAGGQYAISMSASGTVGCATPSSSGGSGNVYVSPTSTIVANEFMYYTANGSSTVSATSSMSMNTSTGKISFANDVSTEIGTLYTHNVVATGGNFQQQNASGQNYFDGQLALGTSTVPTGITLYVAGTTALATTTIVSLNGAVYVPQNFATAGCPAYTTSTDYGACVMAIYNSFASSTWDTIIADGVVATQAQWTTPINFNRNGVSINYISEGGTTLAYGGTGSAVTVNTQNPTGHLITQVGGFNMQGHASLLATGATNTATTTGITCGGTNGCVGVDFHDMSINGFGQQIHQTSNAYMNTYEHIALSGGNGGNMNGSCFIMDAASNSGERTVLDGVNCTDPGNSTTTNAVYFTNGAAASTFIQNLSDDDAQAYIGYSNGLVSIGKIHVENSAYSTYGSFIPIITAANAQYTQLDIQDIEVAQDSAATSTGFQTIIKHGVVLSVEAAHIDNYGNATIALFSDNSLGGSDSERICNLSAPSYGGTPLTNIAAGSAYTLALENGCVSDYNQGPVLGEYVDAAGETHWQINGVDKLFMEASGKMHFVGDVTTENSTLYTHSIIGTGGNFQQQNGSGVNYFAGTLTTGSTTAGPATSNVVGTMNVTGATTLNGVTEASGTQYYSLGYVNATTTASTTAINWNNGNVQSVLLQTSTTMTFNNTVAGGRYILGVIQDGTGSRIVTWPSTVHWSASTAPTLTTTASKMDLITFVCMAVSSTDCYGGANLNYSP